MAEATKSEAKALTDLVNKQDLILLFGKGVLSVGYLEGDETEYYSAYLFPRDTAQAA